MEKPFGNLEDIVTPAITPMNEEHQDKPSIDVIEGALKILENDDEDDRAEIKGPTYH